MKNISYVLKVIMLGAIAIAVTGCATMDSVVNTSMRSASTLAKDGSGIIYGAWLSDPNEFDMKKICDSISKTGKSDDRCKSQSEFTAGAVTGAFGYAAGFVGTAAIAPKSFDLKPCTTGSSSCYYVKAKIEPGKVATVLEVVSRPGDGKCHWGGMPRAGGTVCDSVGWSYRNDLNY